MSGIERNGHAPGEHIQREVMTQWWGNEYGRTMPEVAEAMLQERRSRLERLMLSGKGGLTMRFHALYCYVIGQTFPPAGTNEEERWMALQDLIDTKGDAEEESV